MELNAIVTAVDSEISILQQVRALLTGTASRIARIGRPTGKGNTMSAEARKRIGAATKARWAAGKMGKQSQSRSKKLKAAPAKKKHTMSAAGRARIAAAQKARWAKLKATK
jgi:hypothetical protein